MSVRTNAGFLDGIPVGAGVDWFSNVAPENWMLCQGQAISRTTYAELFKVIGTTYGAGDGVTTFNLPDFRNRTGVGSGSGTFANLGAKIGNETYRMTIANMPTHSHGVTDNGHTHTVNDPGHIHNLDAIVNMTGGSKGRLNTGHGGSEDWSKPTIRGYTGISINASKTGISIQNSGSGQEFSLVQPSLVQNKIIKVK